MTPSRRLLQQDYHLNQLAQGAGHFGVSNEQEQRKDRPYGDQGVHPPEDRIGNAIPGAEAMGHIENIAVFS